MSRYYDFDYDNNCIIGFGSDCASDNDFAFSPGSVSSGDSVGNSASSACPSITDEEIEADITYILEAPTASSKKLKPMKVDVPFLLIGDILKLQQQQIKQHAVQQIVPISYGDLMNLRAFDSNLQYKRGVAAQQVERLHLMNGSYYNGFGVHVVSKNQCHVWRFQVMGNVASVIGIIEQSAKLETNGAYFGANDNIASYSFNTVTFEGYKSGKNGQKQPVYQQMLKSGKYEQPLLIDLKLNMANATLTITNVTVGDRYFGKEVILFSNIDTTKSYKLAFGLLGQEIINLF